MNSPAQGKLVPSGLACGDTEHSLSATVNQAIFTNASFPLSFAFFFAFFFLILFLIPLWGVAERASVWCLIARWG